MASAALGWILLAAVHGPGIPDDEAAVHEDRDGSFPRQMSLNDDLPPGPAPGPPWMAPANPVRAADVPQAQEPARDFDPPHASWEGVEHHFSAQAWRHYVWDEYLTQPEVLLPLGLAVSAAAISHWDRRLDRHWEGVLGDRGYYSDVGQYTLIGAVVLIGAFLPGEGRNWWDEWWTIGEAYAAASLTTFVTKTGVKRPRPGSTPNAHVGTHSFPSGHATSAFTAATLIEDNSGPLWGLPAYGLAAFTAFERVEEGRHHPSDVFAGAAVGTLSAGIFDALHWGSGTTTGIARPSSKLSLEMDGLKGFVLSYGIGF